MNGKRNRARERRLARSGLGAGCAESGRHEFERMLADRGHAFVHCALGRTPGAAEEDAIPLFTGGAGAAITTLAPLFASALNDTGAYSFQSQVRLPWMIAGDDEARFSVELAAKDLRLGVDAASRLGIPTPVSAQTLAQLLSTVTHGHGQRYVVAMRALLMPPDRV